MANYDPNKTWPGIALKTGGTLFLVGLENVEGKIFNPGNPTARYGLSIMSLRLDAGRGAGTGLGAVCVFNGDNPLVRLHNTKTTDWSVNIAVGGQWSKIAKFFKNSKFWIQVTRVGTKLRKLAPSVVEDFRNDLHYIYNALDIAFSGELKLVTIDSPAGVGLELSLNYTIGKIEIS